jgi:rod shape-determining protein MreD
VRALVSFVVTAVAVVIQLTIVDRIAFPGGAGPDLVLLVVAALALAGGPLAGALTGFWAGLALDVAPPGSHFAGQNALVFCLVGYACGLLANTASGDSAEPEHTALFEILVTAAAAVCGEALAALLGVMLSDPRVTWPAIRHVLPAAAAYDVLLSPFVLYAVAAALRLGGVRREDRRPGLSPSQARAPAPVANQGVIRQLAGGNGPRLRLSERDRGVRPAGGLRGPGAPRREPQLKFGRAGQRPAASAFAVGGLAAGASRFRSGGASGFGSGGASKVRFGGAGPGASVLRGSGRGGSVSGSSTMGRSLLGGSVFSRSSASLGASLRFGRPTVFARSAPLGRSSPFRHRGNAIRGAGGGLTGPALRSSRSRSPGWLTGASRRPAAMKSPGRGWLRGSSGSLGSGSLRKGSLRKGWLRGNSGSLRGGSLSGRPARARLRMPRPKVKRRWRTGGYR